MRWWLLLVLVLVGTSPGIAESCIDPSTVIQSTVSITRELGGEERKTTPDVLGVRGTGWFLSPRLIVTAAHVAEAMHLSSRDWKEMHVRERESEGAIGARILRVVGSHSEKIAVLELETSFPRAASLLVRTGPLTPDEQLVSLAYPKNELRFASGRFVQYGADDRFAGAALLEMHDGNDRLVLDHGASGAPVLDCKGRVVAVVSTLLTRTISLPTGSVRVSTAWQTPNVLSIPADVLKGLSSFE